MLVIITLNLCLVKFMFISNIHMYTKCNVLVIVLVLIKIIIFVNI